MAEKTKAVQPPDVAEVQWENAKVTTPEAQIIRRQEWEEVIIRRSMADFFFRGLSIEAIIILLLGTLLGLFYLLSLDSNPLAYAPLSGIIVLVLLAFNAVLIALAYSRSKNSYYRLTPNLYKKQSDVLISIPGTVERYRGLLFRRVEIYPINEFERVSFRQSIVSRIFNSGNIVLHRQKGENLILPNAQNPAKFVAEIQKMIADISGMNPQQQYLTQPS